MTDTTKQETRILKVLINYVNNYSIAPSQREIAKLTGYSVGYVNRLLQTLKKKKIVKKCNNKYLPI